jgi:hypothetical protein
MRKDPGTEIGIFGDEQGIPLVRARDHLAIRDARTLFANCMDSESSTPERVEDAIVEALVGYQVNRR